MTRGSTLIYHSNRPFAPGRTSQDSPAGASSQWLRLSVGLRSATLPAQRDIHLDTFYHFRAVFVKFSAHINYVAL